MPTGVGTPTIPQTMLDLGPAAWFRPEPESPAGNQIRVALGVGMRGGFEVVDQPASQLTAGFASVASGAGFKRVDLVYVDLAGVVQIEQGVDVAVASPNFDGAPGFNLGPPMPIGSPVAYVVITDTGAVTVNKDDIFQINGFVSLGSDLNGYLVDKGLFGSAPAGASDVVTTLFSGDTRITAPTGATEPNSGGDTTQAGFVTTAPLNYTHLLDQNGDEIQHTSGARMYGRLTEAATVWTITYFYLNASGVETSMNPATEATAVPTDLSLVGVPRVFSQNDPARPLFDSSVARLSDQLAGDIPLATESAPGKVQLAADLDTTSGEVVQGDDTRLASPIQAQNSGGTPIGGRYSAVREGAGITLSDLGGGILGIISAAGSPGGKILQVVEIQNINQIESVALVPFDNSPPLVGEGTQIITGAITVAAGSRVLVLFRTNWGTNANSSQVWSCFRAAINVGSHGTFPNHPFAEMDVGSSHFFDAAPATGANTYQIRHGHSSAPAQFTINRSRIGGVVTQRFGTTAYSSMVLIEIGS